MAWGTMCLISWQQGVRPHRSKQMHCLGANLMHGAVEVWRLLEAWFQEQRAAMPAHGPAVLLKTSCSIGTTGRFLQTADTRDKLSCSAIAVVSTSTQIRYAHANRTVPRWRKDHIATFWAYCDRSGNRWEPKRTCVACLAWCYLRSEEQ